MAASFSEPHAAKIARFSPSGSYVATAEGFRLILRDVDTLEIVQLYTNIDTIEDLQWSCDSEFVLCAVQKRGAAQVCRAGFTICIPATDPSSSHRAGLVSLEQGVALQDRRGAGWPRARTLEP